jgi:glycosyltransferase involved in cell wall biosynthesis
VTSPNLAVVVLTYNEEANLPRCLASLQGLKCSLVVVDSGSTDQTLQIAEKSRAALLSHPFENYALQRNWAQENLPFQADWILHLDADERLTPELAREINEILATADGSIDGFLLRKRTIFMGRWIRHGGHYPSYHLRLFRRYKGRCEDRLYDQHFVVDGKVRPLDSDYLDIVAHDLSTWTLRHRRWAELEANEMMAQADCRRQVHPDLLGNPIERRRWFRNAYSRGPLFVRAFAYWSYRYLLRLGFLDGREGLIFHFLQGFWFRFLVDAMIYEQHKV